jgi:hypothetical protein
MLDAFITRDLAKESNVLLGKSALPSERVATLHKSNP